MTAYDVASINSYPAVCNLMKIYGYQVQNIFSGRFNMSL